MNRMNGIGVVVAVEQLVAVEQREDLEAAPGNTEKLLLKPASQTCFQKGEHRGRKGSLVSVSTHVVVHGPPVMDALTRTGT